MVRVSGNVSRGCCQILDTCHGPSPQTWWRAWGQPSANPDAGFLCAGPAANVLMLVQLWLLQHSALLNKACASAPDPHTNWFKCDDTVFSVLSDYYL